MNIEPRKFVPPLGWPIRFRANVIVPANKPKLIGLNRYTKQVIGFAIRLPDAKEGHPYRAWSFRWSEPARWWK